jgi:hypothetical protein
MRYWRAILVAAWLIGVADGQLTQVDLRTQSKSVDFSGANTTKPFKAGTVLPATCSVGEAFFSDQCGRRYEPIRLHRSEFMDTPFRICV